MKLKIVSMVFVLMMLSVMCTTQFATVLAAEITTERELSPDANTVLLDHFDGAALGTVYGPLTYVTSIPGLGRAADFVTGTYVRYDLPTWYSYGSPAEARQGTVELWINPKEYSSFILYFQWYMTTGPPSSGFIVWLYINPEGKLEYWVWNGAGDGGLTGATTIPLNEWTHVAVTWGPAGTRQYINGVVDASSTVNYYPAMLSYVYVYLNAWGQPGLGQKYVDELHISKVQRTDAEIYDHYLRARAEWPMFHHDLQHTGSSTSTAPSTNNTLWNYTTGARVFSSSAVVGGVVYVGSYDWNVYALNATTGTKIWNYTTGDVVASSPAVADGKVYVGSWDGKVYCFGPDTTPPSVVINSPMNITYATSSVPVNATVIDVSGVSTVLAEVDGSNNVTLVLQGGFYVNNAVSFTPDGSHRVRIYANDTVGNTNSAESIYFAVDTTAPIVTINSPTNATYATSTIAINATVIDVSGISIMLAEIDSAYNVTLVKKGNYYVNDTVSFTPDGSHRVRIYANDTVGNMNSSQIVHFTVDTTPPMTTLTVGGPNYTDSHGNLYVTSWTPFTLSAIDGGSGVAKIGYRIRNATYNSGWLTYLSQFNLNGLATNTYSIDYNSTDSVGNVETMHTKEVILNSKATMIGYAKNEIQALLTLVNASPTGNMLKNYLVLNILGPASNENDLAFTLALNGKATTANNALMMGRRMVQGFMSTVMNARNFGMIPQATAAVWLAAAQTIIDDINTAIATP